MDYAQALTALGPAARTLLRPSDRVRPLRVVPLDRNKWRCVISVLSDVLALLPLRNWYRNRAPDKERVEAIASSIQFEGEVDHRMYIAQIVDRGESSDVLYVYDGNHRREALLLTRPFWVEVDILVNAVDADVVRAFRRVNSSVCVPDAYLALDGDDTQNASVIKRAEALVDRAHALWPKAVVVDRDRTQAPRISKNTLFSLFERYARQRPPEDDDWALSALVELDGRHRTNAGLLLRPNTAKIASTLDCYAFAAGIEAVQRALRNMDDMFVLGGV